MYHHNDGDCILKEGDSVIEAKEGIGMFGVLSVERSTRCIGTRLIKVIQMSKRLYSISTLHQIE